MEYIITQYFYPISKQDIKPFWNGMYFDNPRNSDEINKIASLLKRINFEDERPFPEEEHQVGKDYITLRYLINTFFENNQDKPVCKEFYNKHGKEKNIYKVLAKMWIIVRFPITRSNKITENDYYSSYNQTLSHLHFLDFMCNSEGHVPTSIVLDTKKIGNFHIIIPSMIVISSIKQSNRSNSSYPICTFDKIQTYYDNLVNKVGEKYLTKKFQYICDTLKNASELYFTNERMYNVSLCSLIELLVAHKPDNNRYNIEESISKQFVNKLRFILYSRKSIDDIDFLTKELKLAYSVRSDIAHGNFDSIDNSLSKLYKLYGYDKEESFFGPYAIEDALEALNSHLIQYIRELLFYYIEDENGLSMIKDI